jgi:hypothetical protein
MVLALLGIEYSQDDLRTEPLGVLVGLSHVDKEGAKATRAVYIRFPSGSFRFTPDRDWNADDVLKTRIVGLRIDSFVHRKDK